MTEDKTMADWEDDEFDALDEEGDRPEEEVPLGAPGEMAKLNITWGGSNGDLPDMVGFDLTDNEVRQIAIESVRDGYVPGIPAAVADFSDFVVERFRAVPDHGLPNRILLRPKTPFGTQ